VMQRTNANLSLEEPTLSLHVAHWHTCTRKTKSALSQATPDRRGALEAKGAGVASIRVAPETVPRALAVLDGLIRTVEKLGHSVAMQSSPAATLAINGAFVPVTIFEKFVRSHEPADATEMKRRHAYERQYPKYFRLMDLEDGWTHRPSGILTIILSNGLQHGLPNRWADTASHRVESRVEDVATAAMAHAQATTARRERIEARTAERREAEQQIQQRDQESRRVAFFKERADMLDEAQKMERFLQHVRQTDDGYQSEKMFQFVKWAEAHIADLRERCLASAVDRDVVESELWF
jgi:hypothetical protein